MLGGIQNRGNIIRKDKVEGEIQFECKEKCFSQTGGNYTDGSRVFICRLCQFQGKLLCLTEGKYKLLEGMKHAKCTEGFQKQFANWWKQQKDVVSVCLHKKNKSLLPSSQHAHVKSEGTKHRGGAHGRLKTARGSV